MQGTEVIYQEFIWTGARYGAPYLDGKNNLLDLLKAQEEYQAASKNDCTIAGNESLRRIKINPLRRLTVTDVNCANSDGTGAIG